MTGRQHHEMRHVLHKIHGPTLVIDGPDDAGGTGSKSRRRAIWPRLIPMPNLLLVRGTHNYLMEHPENYLVIHRLPEARPFPTE